ncbi:CHRD domain-containing protein [Myxosarcina sp. GI1(2024)]
MDFGTILTSRQAVPEDTNSLATGTGTLGLDEEGNALNYSLTFVLH